MLEWTASVRTATEPVSVPATSFNRISAEFEPIDSFAVRSFSSWTGGSGEAGAGDGAVVGTEALISRRIAAIRRVLSPLARGG